MRVQSLSIIRVFTVIVVAILISATMAVADTASTIAKGLQGWNPQEVTQSGNTLKIVTSERRLTMQIYNAIIGYGVCTAELVSPGILSGIKKIVVLNKFAHSGFVFEGGQKECLAINKTGIGKNGIEIALHTVVYSRK